MKISAYHLGWIGIRVSKVGRASKILKREGWIKMHPADLNNRNGFSYVRPCRTEAEYLATDWSGFARAGMEAVAFWITDAQFGHTAAITDHQWKLRSIVDEDFNRKFPTGRRAA